MSNRVMSVDELSEESFEVLYRELQDNWGTTLANTALGIPGMEVVFAGNLSEIYGDGEMEWDEEQGMCALCLDPMNEGDLPNPEAPFGVCRKCRNQFSTYLAEDTDK